MAYDAAKAHEYYLKYKKKGLKKGRKKGTKTKQTNLVGLSNSGLNEQGKMEWAMAKEKLKSDMNAALAKAKTPEEKDKIRREYQAKALQQLNDLKKNASYAQAKKASAKGSSSKGSKGTSSKGSSGKSSSSSESKNTGGATSTKTTASTATQELTQKANAMINELEDKLAKMTPEKREQAREIIQEQIDLFKKLLGKR